MVKKEEVVALMKSVGITDEQIEALEKRGYFHAPASRNKHLAVEGGLMQHSYNVALKLCELTALWKIPWERPEGPTIVGLLHDLVKMDTYAQVFNPDGSTHWEWQDRRRWFEKHGKASLAIATELGIELKQDEVNAIEFHMGKFNVGIEYLEGEFRSAIRTYQGQVLATHFADWWSSAVVERE